MPCSHAMPLVCCSLAVALVAATTSWESLDGEMLAALHNDPMRDAEEALQLIQMRQRGEKTPSFADTIGNFRQDVIPRLLKAIDDANASTQQLLDTKITTLRNKTNQLTSLNTLATEKDQEWGTCVAREKELIEAWEACKAKKDDLVDGLRSSCDLVDNLKNFSLSNPIASSFECVFPDQFNCTLNLQKWSDDAMDQLKKAIAAYNNASANCSHLRAQREMQAGKCQEKKEAWRNQSAVCSGLLQQRQIAMCKVALAWTRKCDAKTAYETVVAEAMSSGGSMYSQADRIKERATLLYLQCLLTKGADSYGDMAGASSSECKYSPQEAGLTLQLNTQKAAFDSLMEPAKFTCQETKMTFSGTSWMLPHTLANATAANYESNQNHSLPLNTDGDFATFPFCASTPVKCLNFDKCSGALSNRPDDRCHLASGCTAFECCADIGDVAKDDDDGPARKVVDNGTNSTGGCGGCANATKDLVISSNLKLMKVQVGTGASGSR